MKTVKVLLVDDDPNFLDSIRIIFEDNGIQLHCAKSGEEAIELVREAGFDIIFTDMAMPGMSGLEFAGLAKEKLPDVPTYLLTGNARSPELISMAVQAGISEILSKPVSMDVMLELIRRRVEKIRACRS